MRNVLRSEIRVPTWSCSVVEDFDRIVDVLASAGEFFEVVATHFVGVANDVVAADAVVSVCGAGPQDGGYQQVAEAGQQDPGVGGQVVEHRRAIGAKGG